MSIRMKAICQSLKYTIDNSGNKYAEEVQIGVDYSESEANKQWCKWTPSITFTFTISNPETFDKVKAGQRYYIDLIPTDKDG